MMRNISRVLGYGLLSAFSLVGITTIISPSAVAQTVARIQAVTQSGTWNITNVSGTVSLPTGAATDASVNDLETDLDEIAGAVNSARMDVNIAKIGGTDPPTACTPVSVIAAANDDNIVIKGTAGELDSLDVMHIDATPIYVKLYNDVTANIDETDTPLIRLMSPANGTAALGSGFVKSWPGGAAFSTAITMRIVTGITDASTGAPTASEVLVSYCYR
jgi:hypothetical protein